MVVITSPAVPAPKGHYSPGLLIAREKSWLMLSGQVAVDLDGRTPDGIEAQTRLIWQNIKHLLKAAEMDVSDIVKVTSYLTSTDQIAGFNSARAGILGEHKPASTLLVVSGLAAPQYLVEIEVTAAK